MAAPDCYDKAIALLARRGHFRRQLEEKLRRRGYAEGEIEEALERLAARGYLDDSRLARDFVAARLHRGPVGERRLRFELEKRGAPAPAVEEALRLGYGGVSDVEAAREAAARWRRRGGGDVGRLARHLDRLGFPASTVLQVVEEERRRGGAPE